MMIMGIAYLILGIIWLFFTLLKERKNGKKALNIALTNFLTRLPDIFAIFLLLGIFNQFVPRNIVFRYMGNAKGIWDHLLALFFGSIAAGPPATAYPLGQGLLAKGAAVSVVAVFLAAWVKVGFISIGVEIKSFGKEFVIWRNIVALISCLLIGALIQLLYF